MRIKLNCTAFEVEVLDRNDKSIYHVRCENYAFDGDVRGVMREVAGLKADVDGFFNVGADD